MKILLVSMFQNVAGFFNIAGCYRISSPVTALMNIIFL